MARLTAPAPGQEAYRAYLQFLQQPGVGAWLDAPPSDALGLRVMGALFKTMVRLRLRLPVTAGDAHYPMYDGIMDQFGDRIRVCPCGGDRTKRHHRLRSVLASKAHSAGLSPEVEKPGLLPPRPDTEGLEEETRNGPGRRPADVWVGNWGVHGPAAFDLAVTSGMLQAVLPHTVSSGSHVALEYEARKRQYQDTQVQYPAQGLQFIPLVTKAFGGDGGRQPCKLGAP